MSQGSQKRIIFCITKSNFGGAQKYVYDIATHFSQKASVEVCVGGSGTLVNKLQEAHISTYTLPSLDRDISIFGDIRAFFHLWRYIRSKEPDVLQLNSSKMVGMGSLVGRLTGCKLIVSTIHGLAFNEKRPWYQKIMIVAAYVATVTLNHKIIAVSSAVATQLKKITPKWLHYKIVVVPNGVNEFPTLDAIKAKKELGIPENVCVIGTIGELHPIKGHRYLIEAFSILHKQYPHTHLCIIGDGELSKETASLVSSYDIQKATTLTGFKNNAQQYLKAFNYFILPSLSEALGFVLLEAAIAHVPVIATSVGGIPEIVEDMKSGILVRSESSQELAHSIEFALHHTQDMNNMADSLYTRVIQNFSTENMLSMTSSVLGL